jgi:hypothetical protein
VIFRSTLSPRLVRSLPSQDGFVPNGHFRSSVWSHFYWTLLTPSRQSSLSYRRLAALKFVVAVASRSSYIRRSTYSEYFVVVRSLSCDIGTRGIVIIHYCVAL